MKLPNGYGSVYKLSGSRRKPYGVRVTTGWDFDENSGKNKQLYKNIGYYETRAKALQALADYNKNPYDVDVNLTFAEVYNKWSAVKFEKISRSNENGYKASYKRCEDLYNAKFREIRLSHLQKVIDNAKKNSVNYPTLKKIKILFNQLFDYAVKEEIISKDKNLSEYVDIGDSVKSTKHYRFTNEEIITLFEWAPNNEYVKVILILIYSGVRPGELFNLKTDHVNLENKCFNIDKGKNTNSERIVPIHDKVLPYFEHWYNKQTEYLITQLNGEKIRFDTNHGQFTETYWKPLLEEIGIYTYKNEKGEIKEHKPDDTRHTFTTMWKEKKLDEAMRRKIQGHSGKGIGEQVYSHISVENLIEEINKL